MRRAQFSHRSQSDIIAFVDSESRRFDGFIARIGILDDDTVRAHYRESTRFFVDRIIDEILESIEA